MFKDCVVLLIEKKEKKKKEREGRKRNPSDSLVPRWNKVQTDNVTNNVKRTNETKERVTGVLINERILLMNRRQNQLMSSNVQIHDKIESVVCTKDRVCIPLVPKVNENREFVSK